MARLKPWPSREQAVKRHPTRNHQTPTITNYQSQITNFQILDLTALTLGSYFLTLKGALDDHQLAPARQ